MRHTRRTLLTRAAPLIAVSPLLFDARASADTVTYQYDAMGRVVQATYSGGVTVLYTYDGAGNRTRVVRTNGSPYNTTLQVTGTTAVNLRTLADNFGYPGITDANVIFEVGSAVTLIGGIDTGTWPSATQSITLTLRISGKVYGNAGGGSPGSDLNVHPGFAGGDAITCHENISVTVNAGGEVKGGGGGGGGGGAWNLQNAEGEWQEYLNGGAGGSGFPIGSAGSPGSTIGMRSSGAGGAGGAAGSSGGGGSAATGTVVTHFRKIAISGAGAGGYAIRKNGKTVPVTNNGTIAGTVG